MVVGAHILHELTIQTDHQACLAQVMIALSPGILQCGWVGVGVGVGVY